MSFQTISSLPVVDHPVVIISLSLCWMKNTNDYSSLNSPSLQTKTLTLASPRINLKKKYIYRSKLGGGEKKNFFLVLVSIPIESSSYLSNRFTQFRRKNVTQIRWKLYILCLLCIHRQKFWFHNIDFCLNLFIDPIPTIIILFLVNSYRKWFLETYDLLSSHYDISLLIFYIATSTIYIYKYRREELSSNPTNYTPHLLPEINY